MKSNTEESKNGNRGFGHGASRSLPQRKQLRARAEEEIPLRDRDAGAVARGVAVVFEIRGVEQFEFAAASLHHGHIGVEIHDVDFAAGGSGVRFRARKSARLFANKAGFTTAALFRCPRPIPNLASG